MSSKGFIFFKSHTYYHENQEMERRKKDKLVWLIWLQSHGITLSEWVQRHNSSTRHLCLSSFPMHMKEEKFTKADFGKKRLKIKFQLLKCS
jgi:hypothetical protein